MIAKIMVIKKKKKENEEGNFGNYRMNYLTEFDLNIDIVLIGYMFVIVKFTHLTLYTPNY